MTLHPAERKLHFPEDAPVELDPIQRALKENEDWNRDLVEHSEDLLCIHDLQGRLLAINPAPARVLCYTVEELLQIPLREIIAPEFRNQFDDYLSHIARVGAFRGFMAVMTRSGQRRIWEYHNTLRTEGVASPIVRGMARDVTEQKKAERLAREASELNRQIISSASDGVVVYDRNLRCLAWNPSVEKLTGIAASAALGKSHEELVRGVGGPELASAMERAGLGETIALPDIKSEGRHVQQWISCRTGPLRNQQGEITGVIVTLHDVTERHRAENRLQEYARVVEGLEEMIIVVDREYRYLIANHAFLKYRGMTREQVVGRLVEDVVGKEVFDRVVKERIDECFEGNVVRYELHYKFPNLGERDLFVSYFPIEGPIGIDRVAAVLQDITERKRAEGRLREYEKALEGLEEMIVVVDREYRYVIANRASLKYRQMEKEQLVGRLAPEVLNKGVFEAIKPKLDECFQGKVVKFERRYTYPHLGERDLLISYFPVEGPTGIDRVAAVLQDVTERKRAEESLRESEARLRLAQEVAKIGTFERNLQTGESRWTPEMEAMYGLEPGAAPRSLEAFLQLVHPEDRPHVEHLMAESIETGETEGEWRVIWPDGTVRWIAGRWRVFKDEQGKPLRAIGINFDITERKRTEEELRARQELIAQAQSAAHLGCFNWDMKSNRIVWSPEQEKIYGLAPGTFGGRYEDWRAMVFPEDLERAEAGVEDTIEREDAWTEFRIRHQSTGEIRWVGVKGRVFVDKDGKPLRMIGVNMDITKRKRTEEALRESEERLRLAQEAAQIGTFEGNFLTGENRWTTQMEAIYGLPPGGFPRTIDQFVELVHPDDRQQVKQWISQSMDSGEAHGEWRVIWPNGTVRWISGRWRVFKDASGIPARAIGMDFDITERKLVEEELRLAKEKLAEEKVYLEEEIDTQLGFGEIIGKSATLRAIMEQVSKVATSDATVLIMGETGTGKELVARAIHRMSTRRESSFIKMNCAAIPSGLLESELFGHEKGAFTGAIAKKLGRLELADRGTLFLDEIGEIPLALQPKLLRVLQDQEFERLGSTHTLKVDFRLIAATNRDLWQEMNDRRFRSDLYYRLNVFPVRVPPLRERREDIPLLVEHFVRKCAASMNKTITSIPKKTMEALQQWDWPGNIRELENFVERSVILTRGSVLQAPLKELDKSESASDDHADDTLEAKEREHIVRALRQSHGRLGGTNGAAERLGMSRTTLQSKLKRLGIDPQQYRD